MSDQQIQANEFSAPITLKKIYQPPVLSKLDEEDIQGGNTKGIAENTAGGGWIASGS